MKSLILAAMIAALATTAQAQSSMQDKSGSQSAGPAASQGQQKISAATRQFVQKAAITDMFEIQAGQLAQQTARDPDYKEFGQMIVTDHQQTSSQLKSIAQGVQGLDVPTDLDSAHKQKMSKLQSLSGSQFETQFKTDQVQGHQQAVKLYQDYAKSGDNAGLKQFAQQTLPKLQEHLKHAQALPKPGVAPTVGSGTRPSR